MDPERRLIKENQKSLLKKYTVDKPRLESEQTYSPVTGKTRGNRFFLDSFRYGNWSKKGDPKGQDIVGLGPWIEDPRKGNRIASRHDMDIKRSIQKRDQYIGPYSATGQQTDYRSISSEINTKYKGERGRHMLFRRGYDLPETVFTPSKRIQKKTTRLANPDTIDDKWDRRDYEKIAKNSYNHTSFKKLDDEIQIGQKQTHVDYHYTPSTNFRETILTNQNYIAEDILSNLKKQNYQDKVFSGKKVNDMKKISNIILWNKAIKEYKMEKIPLYKSRHLDEKKKSMIKEYIKTGRKQTEIVQDILKFNNEIMKKISLTHQIKLTQRLEEDRINVAKYTQQNSKVKMIREILSSGEEFYYDVKGTDRIQFGNKSKPLRDVYDGFDQPDAEKKYHKNINFQIDRTRPTFELDKRYDDNDKVMYIANRGYDSMNPRMLKT